MMVYAKLIRAVCARSIAKQVLTDRKVLASATENGKKSFDVCTPDYATDHWSKQYWDDFSPFVQPIVQ